MIIPGMTYQELITEVSKDSDKIFDIIFREVLSIRKPKELRDRYPDGKTLKTVTYKSRVTGNKYFIQPKAKYDPTQKVSKLAGTGNVFVRSYDSRGKQVWIKVPVVSKKFMEALISSKDQDKLRLARSSNMFEAYIYTPHFLRRYNERFLHRADLEDNLQSVLEIYLSRNSTRICNHVSGKWEHETEDRLGYETRVQDGVELGMIIRDWIFQSNTFISDEMLREDQEWLGKTGEVWKKYLEITEARNSYI